MNSKQSNATEGRYDYVVFFRLHVGVQLPSFLCIQNSHTIIKKTIKTKQNGKRKYYIVRNDKRFVFNRRIYSED